MIYIQGVLEIHLRLRQVIENVILEVSEDVLFLIYKGLKLNVNEDILKLILNYHVI